MNTRHEALSPEEAALARALRGLPELEPPPQLDAQVLAMARAALPQARSPRSGAAGSTAATKRRRRSAWFGAGFGTLAASVFAAVIGVQMGWFGGSLPGEPASSPAAESSARRQAVGQAAADEEGHVEIQFVPAPASPAPPAAESRDSGAAPASEARAAARKAAAPPPPPAPPAPAAAPAERFQQQRTEEPEQAKMQVSGAMRARDAQAAPGAALPHWREDATLPPPGWLERIRERVRQGDRAGAERSLRMFQQEHPGQPVPDDLLSLLAG